jgi:hypothetical protein
VMAFFFWQAVALQASSSTADLPEPSMIEPNILPDSLPLTISITFARA